MKYLLVILVSVSLCSYSQEKFINPLDIPMYLSGSFAELRSNHFHSGIDIKTDETVGHPVFSIADGWVSRIKVSPWGFGHVVYINHFNGYISVYAHLDRFNDKLTDLVLSEQYRKKSFSIDKYFKKGEYLVSQAEIIAFSGNTGGSGGPHLHFEMREIAGQKPINPLQFNFDIKDTIPPTFKALVAYNGSDKRYFTPVFSNGIYVIIDTVFVNDNFEMGIVSKDESNNSKNRLGVNKIDYYLDGVLMYSYKNEKFSYAETRYANAHIDYEEYKTNGTRIQKMFVELGNHLSCYSVLKKHKQIECNQFVNGEIRIQDSKKNKSVLKFIVKRSCDYKKIPKVERNYGKRFFYNKDNAFKTSNVKVFVPSGALYSDVDFSISSIADSRFIGGAIYSIHKETTPLQKRMILKIKYPKINPLLKKKLVIVKKTKQSISAEKTVVDGEYLKISTREFGDYTISIDSVAPKISFKKFGRNGAVHFLSFNISDNLSGISAYNGYVDGHWVLFQYDYKTKSLYYIFDKYLVKEGKKRTVLLKVSDSVGNISSYKKIIEY